MREEIIRKAAEFLKTELNKTVDFADRTKRMVEYRIEHSFRVAGIAREIARAKGFDEERMYVAARLHDIGYVKQYESAEDSSNHGREGAKIARPFFTNLGYSDAEVEEMCYAIAIHVDDTSDFEGERTPFAITIGDADNIDRFDVYRIYEGLEFLKFSELPLSEQITLADKRINKLKQFREYPFGTKTGDKMWHEKVDFQLAFFNRLKNQLEKSDIEY